MLIYDWQDFRFNPSFCTTVFSVARTENDLQRHGSGFLDAAGAQAAHLPGN